MKIKISFGAGKPDSVPPEQFGVQPSFLSRPPCSEPALLSPVSFGIRRTTQGEAGCGIPVAIGRAVQPPILPCTGRGFSCRRRCRRRGGLLPHLFTLTLSEPPCGESNGAVIFCDTFRRRALTRGARTCGEARAASCPAVSGLSSPNFYRARHYPRLGIKELGATIRPQS